MPLPRNRPLTTCNHKSVKYQVQTSVRKISGVVNLPASKSISNRALILNALSYSAAPVQNLSDSDDTRVLEAALRSNDTCFDIGHAGTAMRFLTAFLAKIAGKWEITGSERMKQRPIKILVDALNQLGARIEYLENDGFPPLRIFGSHLKGGILELDGSISSQYISALLMIAPTMEGGLTLRLKNRITSRSYIELTLKLMGKFGVSPIWKGNEIHVPEQVYRPVEFTVESDWSAASYWYQLLALCESGEIVLNGLEMPSLQGDAAIAGWFEGFGIQTIRLDTGVKLVKNQSIKPSRLFLKFHETPDVAQTMAVLCVGRGVPFHFSGLETLKIKETNRIAALCNELGKLGATLTEPREGELKWDGKINPEQVEQLPVIETYHDHRMAMAFAPLALTGQPLLVNDPGVVSKSYPNFWNDLKTVGVEISEIP